MPGEADCKRDCKTKCDFDVDVNLEVRPEVRCRELSRRPASFEVELDFDAKPKCCVREARHKKSEKGCTTGCVFIVDVEFECKAVTSKPICPCPLNRYRVDLEIEHHAQCHLEKPCHREERSHCSKEDDKEEKKEEKKEERKHRKHY